MQGPFVFRFFHGCGESVGRKEGTTMKKRSFSVLLACCMLLTLLPVAALATEGPTGSGGTVIELTQDNIRDYVSNGLTAGAYKLGGNATVESGSLRVTGTVTLDLNGYTLTFKDPVSFNDPTSGVTYYYNQQGNTRQETFPIGILVYGGYGQGATSYTLTLTDSNMDKTGTLDVQGANATGIYVGCNCTLDIAGGTITNSTTVKDRSYYATGVRQCSARSR